MANIRIWLPSLRSFSLLTSIITITTNIAVRRKSPPKACPTITMKDSSGYVPNAIAPKSTSVPNNASTIFIPPTFF